MKNYPIIAICYQTKWFTALSLLVTAICALFAGVIILLDFRGIDTYWFIKPSLPFWVLATIWGLINAIYASPTFWIHEEGITIVFPFRKIFVEWDEIVQVRQVGFMIDVFFHKLTIFNLLIGLSVLRLKPMIRLIFRRKNQKIFIKMVTENIPDKLK